MITRREACFVILTVALVNVSAFHCPTKCICQLYDTGEAEINCTMKNNSMFTVEIEPYKFRITIKCINSPDWSDFHVNMTALTKNKNIKELKFEMCNLPSNNSLGEIAQMLGAADVKALFFRSDRNMNSHLVKHHLDDFENLKYLYLQINNLSYVDEDLLVSLVNLTGLKLHVNNLHLVAGFFNYTPGLEWMRLGDNGLRSIELGTFDKLKDLTGLSLANNNLTELQSGIFDELVAVETLHLQENDIVELPEDIFAKLENLKSINLSENSFTDLPRNLLENNAKLNIVKLNANKRNMTTLPNKFFANLAELKSLNLRANGFVTLPEDLLWGCTSLIKITLGQNYLQTLPVDIFRDLKELKKLYLYSNNLETLPQHIFHNLKKLKELYLNSNDLETLPQHIFHNLKELKELYLNSNDLETLPDHIFSNTNQLKILYLSKNRITSISRNLFNGLSALKVLNMEENQLMIISFYAFSTLINLEIAKFFGNRLNRMPDLIAMKLDSMKKLILSHNGITEISLDGLSSTIQVLELHNNNISRIHPDALKFLKQSTNLTQLTLHENPWECDCDAKEFQNFIRNQTRNVLIPYLFNVKCVGSNISVLETTDLCAVNTTMIIGVSITISLMGSLMCFFGLLYYKYQRQIKVWLFAHQWCLWFVTEEELDKEKLYDAFVSYSHKDHEFVENELVSKLENGSTPFKLCLHYRDWLVGEWIPASIARSVEDSRRTIVVLSPNFLESIWGRMEFRTAHSQALSEGRTRVILILYGDIGPIDNLDPELKAYISMNTYVKWGDPWFWDKLKYALPHQSNLAGHCDTGNKIFENHQMCIQANGEKKEHVYQFPLARCEPEI